MRHLLPEPDELTAEQIIEVRETAPPYLQDLCDVALGPRFLVEERRAARIELAIVYATTRGPLADLLSQLARWAAARAFDEDQAAVEDTDDEKLVRAFSRWQRFRR